MVGAQHHAITLSLKRDFHEAREAIAHLDSTCIMATDHGRPIVPPKQLKTDYPVRNLNSVDSGPSWRFIMILTFLSAVNRFGSV